MAYRRTTKQLKGEISLNGKQLHLLMAIDEKKSAAQIASETGFDGPTFQKNLASLLELGLIESVQSGGPFLDRKFLNSLKISLTRSLGPMAGFLIEDVTADMGVSVDKIPVARAAELITAIAREISDGDAGDKFKKSIIPLMPK